MTGTTTYHVTGAVSAAIFLLTLSGLLAQLRIIFERRRIMGAAQAVAILSLNQFVSSFLAFFVFFLYGLCLLPVNHYLLWTRAGACLLVLAVLRAISRGRNSPLAKASFLLCAGLMLASAVIFPLSVDARAIGRSAAQVATVVVTVIVAQGYLHQVYVIRRSGETGAVSRRMHQYMLAKDVSTVLFGVAMGVQAGWPLILMNGVSGITKVITLWHFRWVRVSATAARRRREPPSSGLSPRPD